MVDVDNVVDGGTARNVSSLVAGDMSAKNVKKGIVEKFSNKLGVRVGKIEGTGIAREWGNVGIARVDFLGNKDEKGIIKMLVDFAIVEEVLVEFEKKESSLFRAILPGSVGDAIRTWSGILSGLDDAEEDLISNGNIRNSLKFVDIVVHGPETSTGRVGFVEDWGPMLSKKAG